MPEFILVNDVDEPDVYHHPQSGRDFTQADLAELDRRFRLTVVRVAYYDADPNNPYEPRRGV